MKSINRPSHRLVLFQNRGLVYFLELGNLWGRHGVLCFQQLHFLGGLRQVSVDIGLGDPLALHLGAFGSVGTRVVLVVGG